MKKNQIDIDRRFFNFVTDEINHPYIKEDYTQEDFIYAKQKAIENQTLADSTIPIQFNPLVSLVQFDVWMCESLKLRKNKMNKVNSEPEDFNWWENKENFPCMLIADVSNIALVWVHYQIDGIAYDVRDNGYRLIEHTNWRRATREEIINNIKGL